jgi:aminoglycoside phosphotransferase family enzyme/predicted kinase
MMEVQVALARPETYPHRPAAVEVRETHISWVFLAGEMAYKLKKPLVLDFVDYGTRERRHEMCREEVRLNRRLAPDIYVGVRGVAITDGDAQLTAEDDPRAVEFLVEMRRYDERETLAAKLERGELGVAEIEAAGAALARFHAHARRVHASEAPVLAVERRFERNLHELLGCLEQRGEIARVLALERFAHAFVSSHSHTFARRASTGAVREGHGDLRAEHVLVDGEVRVVDCVEFDPQLRELDVADDLAFLVFDLAVRGGGRFGEALVRAYRQAGGDPGDDALIAFYATYRALVRAKIALVRASQLPTGGAEHGRQSARARDLIMLAERFAWRARLPLVVIVCGLPASGKSELARRLAGMSGLTHLNSDITRKRLAGFRPTERGRAQIYDTDWNARTYAELGRLAAQEVSSHRGAIVDATCRHLADRQAFRAAFGSAAAMLFVECHAPGATLAQRAARRARALSRISDADAAVVAREQQSWEPLDEVPAAAHLAVRTDRSGEEVLSDVLALIDQRLLERAPQ